MLKKVVVKNFMCHDNFEITLNPRVNFITGQNGSGKSAIVAALMLGFGQRATVTNRGQSVKDFIKRGKHSAVLEITLYNNPDMAFEFEKYGPEVTVIRKITESSSTYSLRDCQGKIHPCNAKLLNALLLHFSIQPNNPLCILSQDVARTFLQKFDPRSLYNLYSQATLSKTINECYADSKENIRKTQLQLARKDQDIEKLKAEVEEAEKRKQFAERYLFLNERLEEVKNEVVWSKIKSLEIAAQKKVEIQGELDSERDELLRKIRNGSEEALQTKLQELLAELGQSKEKIANIEIQVTKENDKLSKAQEELAIFKQHFNETEQQIQRIDREIKNLEEASNKILKVNVPEIQRQKKELESLVAKIQELEAAKKTTEVHLNQLRDTYENSAPELERINSEIRRVTNKMTESRGKIELYKKGKSLALYGQWMPRFVEELNRAADKGRFTQRPKGPLGSYLQVVDPEWAPAIEKHLKGSLSQFLLNSQKDLNVFNEIAEKFVPGTNAPSVSICQFAPKVHNYSQHEVKHPNYSSLIRLLKCSDPDVLNCLIDENKIEHILLVPVVDDACHMCEEEANVPRNLRFCLTLDSGQVFPSPSYKYYAGRMRSRVANLLQVDPAQHLTYLERTIANSQEELISLKNKRKNNEESTNSVTNDISGTQRSLDSIRKQLNNLNGRKLELETKIDFEPVSIDLYKQDIEMLVSEKEKSEQKKEEINSKINKAEVSVKEVVKYLKNLSEVLRPLSTERNSKLQLIDSTEKDIRDAKRLATQLQARFNTLTDKETALREDLQKISKTIQEMTEKAQQTATEVENVRDLLEVENELKEIKGELLGLKDFCQENPFEAAEKEFDEKKNLLISSQKFMAHLKKTIEKAQDKLQKDLKTIDISEKNQFSVAKNLFSEVLKKRGLQGTFSLDDNNQLLKMHVVSGKEKATGKRGEISSLSGGEKSFATIAFIIAVWESMTVPFFVMDEFDVFTDVLTRNTILRMLTEYSSQNSAQFIFLTPHDLSNINTSRDDVTVHRINSPRA